MQYQQETSMTFLWRQIDGHLGQIISILTNSEKLNNSPSVFIDLEKGINNISSDIDIQKKDFTNFSIIIEK